MEVDGVFLYVGFDRKEILIDEGRDFIVGIGFGLQPNACASSRSSAEVEQQGLLVSLCLSEYRINVFVPLNSHFQSLLETKSNIGIALVINQRRCLTLPRAISIQATISQRSLRNTLFSAPVQ
jgi:hypothetical protein